MTTDAPPKTVFDGDYLSVGAGVAYGPSYSGSDEYAAFTGIRGDADQWLFAAGIGYTF